MRIKVPPRAPKVEPKLKNVHQPFLPITNNLKATIKSTTTKVPILKPQKQLSSPKVFSCKFCKRQYTHRSALFKHLTKNHPTKSASKMSGLIKCHEENCTFSCRYISELRLHLTNSHSIPIESETKSFDTIEGTVHILREYICTYVSCTINTDFQC